MTVLSAAGEARALATERFVDEWRDPDSWVRREARERLAGGLWSGPVIEQALDNAFSMSGRDMGRVPVSDWFQKVSSRALRTLVVLPGNIIGPALHAAYRVAVTGASAIFKASSTERALAEILQRQWTKIGAPLAGALEARYWPGGDLDAESAAFAQVQNVIVFGSDETIEAVRARIPAGVKFTGHGTKYSFGVVMPDADLRAAAEDAAVDVCMFDQAGCRSPQTIYVAGDGARALRFAQALDASMRNTTVRLPRMRPSADEAAAENDVLRRTYLTALDAPTHGLSPILPGADNGGCPDYLIVVEPQGPPRTYGFGRVVVIMPLANGFPPVLTGSIELLGVAGGFDDWPAVATMLHGDADWADLNMIGLGGMHRIIAQPYANDFIRHAGMSER